MTTHDVLIVDDEPAITDALRPVLTSQGYRVAVAANAAAALVAAERGQFPIVLLDLGLPDADGKDLIPKFRELGPAVIIVLSARDREGEKVAALDAGADDYLNKPFGIDELLARIRVGLRHLDPAQREQHEFRSRELVVSFDQRRVLLFGEETRLSPKEFDLLAAMCRQAGQVVTHRRLLLAGWNDPATDGQYLRSYIALLRQKLEEDASEPTMILTEPGVGYRLNVTPF